MDGILMLLAIAAQGAVAQSPVPGTGVSNPDITVTGDNRVVCRRTIRTETRIGAGRICRTVAQWREAGGAESPDNPNATIDGAADTLETLDQKVSTNDIGGELTVVNGRGMNGRTPLGPR